MAIVSAPMMFSTMPARAISAMEKRLLPKTMAFGGVATGIMNAQEADSVAGTISSSGWMPVATATAASIGRMVSVVAVLLVSSVRKVMARHTSRISTNTGNTPTAWNWSPIICANPVRWKPVANARPPPISNTTFHGRFVTTSPPITRRSPAARRSSLRAGMKNSKDAMPMAMVPSSMNLGHGSSRDQPGSVKAPRFKSTRNTHKNAVAANTASTAFSSKAIGPSAARCPATTSGSIETLAGARYSTWVMTSQAITSITTPTGRATIIHWLKAMVGASGKSTS